MAQEPRPPGDKPAIMAEQEFTLHEGWPYRVLRTGAIWLNKLFFSSLVLLLVWLVVGSIQGAEGCAQSFTVTQDGNTTGDQASSQCSVLLTPTAKYLGGMAVVSFILQLLFGFLGLLVGKRVLERTRAADELGAKPPEEGP